MQLDQEIRNINKTERNKLTKKGGQNMYIRTGFKDRGQKEGQRSDSQGI